MLVAVKCPECGHGTTIHGRGRCPNKLCGAYLWYQWKEQRPVLAPKRTWVFDNSSGKWRRYVDLLPRELRLYRHEDGS